MLSVIVVLSGCCGCCVKCEAWLWCRLWLLCMCMLLLFDAMRMCSGPWDICLLLFNCVCMLVVHVRGVRCGVRC